MRGRQPEGEPALEHGRVRGSLEAADVVTPVAEAAGGQRQPAAQRLPHRGVGGLAVPAPVHGEPLTAGGGGAGEEDGLPLAAPPPEEVEDGAVVQARVVVVHPLRVGAVVPGDAGEVVVTGDLEAGAAVGGAAVVDELDPDDAVGDAPAERSPSRRHGQCAPDYINGSTNSLEERPRSTARVDGINGQDSWRLEPPSESGLRRRAFHPTPHHQLLFTTGILVVSPHAPDASRPSAGPSGRPAGGEGPGSRSARNAHPSTGPVVRSAGAGAGFP